MLGEYAILAVAEGPNQHTLRSGERYTYVNVGDSFWTCAIDNRNFLSRSQALCCCTVNYLMNIFAYPLLLTSVLRYFLLVCATKLLHSIIASKKAGVVS